MELKFIEQKLMGSSNIAMTDLNKVNFLNELPINGNAHRSKLPSDQMQFTPSQNSIDQFLWSPSNVAASPGNPPNHLLMKFWNNPKQSAGGHKAAISSIGRNAKSNQPIVVGYNQNNCDEATNEPNELDVKIKEVHSPHRDYKEANSSSSGNSGNTNNVTIVHPPAPKDFGCDDTYEDGIDKDMRDLERRLESELEEHEKLWSPEEEPPISQT